MVLSIRGEKSLVGNQAINKLCQSFYLIILGEVVSGELLPSGQRYLMHHLSCALTCTVSLEARAAFSLPKTSYFPDILQVSTTC